MDLGVFGHFFLFLDPSETTAKKVSQGRQDLQDFQDIFSESLGTSMRSCISLIGMEGEDRKDERPTSNIERSTSNGKPLGRPFIFQQLIVFWHSG